KLYSITEKGEQLLVEKLLSLLGSPEHMRWQVDVALYNLTLLPKSKIVNALTTYQEGLHKKIEGYNDLLQYLKDSDCPPHRFEVAKRPILLLQADLYWATSYLEGLMGEK
ncbi:MAG: hypothetical protein MUO54_06695, partial [Anaerolineales bacterium]|nr:hypothetical protein [Anaerolineales bacterium]